MSRGFSERRALPREGTRFEGVVVAGQGRGRGLGFPTANLCLDDEAIEGLPRGVYAATVAWSGEGPRRGVVNIGRRPTFEGGRQLSVEVHVLDFDGDLYGQRLRIHLGRWLREERRFASVEALRRQIARDVELTRADGCTG